MEGDAVGDIVVGILVVGMKEDILDGVLDGDCVEIMADGVIVVG